MNQCYRVLAFLLIAGMFSVSSLAQTTTISGTAKNAVTAEVLASVSILIKGNTGGSYTDANGMFNLTTSQKPPFTLIFTSIGYADKEVVVTGAGQIPDVLMEPVVALAQEVVVSASRLPEKILESPVTVEKVTASNIRNSAQSNYYDVIGNLKGVDLVTSSLLFKTPSTRGFNSSGNYRLNQLVDGMDNQAPGLNFSVGSLVGVTELDVDNMELLGGASSALYGPGGMNGTLLINSKNPFKYQGLSWQIKQGVTHIDRKQTSTSPYYDWTFRWAKKVSDKFAFKFGGQFVQTRDWIATNYDNYNAGTNPASGKVIGGDRYSDPNYNGVNVYGDETTADLKSSLTAYNSTVLAQVNLPGYGPYNITGALALGTYTSGARFDVSRTGYRESEVLDPTTTNVKLSGSLNYKITSAIEASLSGFWGYGNTVYTGSDRYSLKGVKIGQYKLELKHKNWFVRGYTTQENAGESFNATVTTRLFNEAWKPSQAVWYPQFLGSLIPNSVGTFGAALGQAYGAALSGGQTAAQAVVTAQNAAINAVAANRLMLLNAARDVADVGRPKPGSDQFKTLFNQVARKPISAGGGLFLDKSDLYMTEGQYNLTDLFKGALEVVVGANFKQYVLNSEGTLFAEDILGGIIKLNEYGGYALVSKSVLNDRLKLTASGRFDKNDNFKGRFTPRFSAVVKVAQDHNIRLSYQNAYRFPSTQQQYINLDIGGGTRLIGGLPFFRDYYKFSTNPVYTPESVAAFAQSGNPALLVQKTFKEFKPEEAKSYEVGYKGLIAKKLLIDIYGYYTEYKNFTGREVGIQAGAGGLAAPNIYSIATNSTSKVNTQGWGASVEYLLPRNFSLNANLFSDEIKNVPANFIAFFNAPKYRANIGLTNTGLLFNKKLGFGLTYHYQDGVYFEGDFGSGNIPSFITLDGQVSYKITETRSIVKLGATNLLNKYYRNAFGNPQIGGLYYISYAYNVF